jgi:hypothetical protein
MNKRPLIFLLTGLLCAGVTALATPGCGRSVAGEYQRVCISYCEAAEACEGYGLYQAFPYNQCVDDCRDQAADFEDGVLDECSNGVDIDGAQVDRCVQARNQLATYCRADDESEINEAFLDTTQECPADTHQYYECR